MGSILSTNGPSDNPGTIHYWAALFLGVGAWTKNEGLPFALAGAAGMFWAVRLRILAVRDLVPIAAVLLLFILPWTVYKQHMHATSAYLAGASAGLNAGMLARLPIILSSFGSRLLKVSGPTNLLFYLYVSALTLNRRRLRVSSACVVDLLLASQLLVYVVTFMVSPYEIRWTLSTTTSRLILHLIPLAMFATAVHAFEWISAARVHPSQQRPGSFVLSKTSD